MHEVLVNKDEKTSATRHPKIMRAVRKPIDGAWLEDQLVELERLVAENDYFGVPTQLRNMVKSPRRDESAVLEDTLH
jgi:FlaA1/EpsC-like NDP-sugar epimerase